MRRPLIALLSRASLLTLFALPAHEALADRANGTAVQGLNEDMLRIAEAFLATVAQPARSSAQTREKANRMEGSGEKRSRVSPMPRSPGGRDVVTVRPRAARDLTGVAGPGGRSFHPPMN